VIAWVLLKEGPVSVSHPHKRNGKSHAAVGHGREAIGTGGVDALLDEWVARLEQPMARPARSQSGPIARERPRPVPARPEQLETQRGDAVREALSRLTIVGSTIVFGDETGGEIVLARGAQRTVHRGTVGVRGPLGLSSAALMAHGLTENQARAVEFVGAWFGTAFDAASVTRGTTPISLKWGFWPFDRSEIARALEGWKTRAPERFATMVGAYGIDVFSRDDLRGPALMVVDTRGAMVRGDKALDIIASDPRRLAILARAGRDEHARAAQVAHAVAAAVLPLLRAAARRGDARVTVGEVVQSARGVAALLCAVRGLDQASFDEVARVAVADGSIEAGEDATLEAVARYLRVSGRTSAAHDVRRALSSHELLP
jgi:hypothetical protein